jgi:hypothetical protein
MGDRKPRLLAARLPMATRDHGNGAGATTALESALQLIKRFPRASLLEYAEGVRDFSPGWSEA